MNSLMTVAWAALAALTLLSHSAVFVCVVQRHKMRKAKYSDQGPARGVPYNGIENLRPESKAAVEAFLFKQSTPAL